VYVTIKGPSLQAPLLAQDLSPAQRSLVALMHVHQFGRIENLPVRAGEPTLNSDVNSPYKTSRRPEANARRD
jgi:hypothetical protein